jgi:hypothetical protein
MVERLNKGLEFLVLCVERETRNREYAVVNEEHSKEFPFICAPVRVSVAEKKRCGRATCGSKPGIE